jgi:hypothetical protein
VTRRFRDGHPETWWAADATLGGWGPDRRLRLVAATTDPARLPGHSSWYLLTNLPRPASRRARQADLAEVVRLYGLRTWVEQGYKQVKGELGWADFQVRSDRASAGTGRWSVARSRSAGRPSSPSNPTNRPHPTRRPPRRSRGGPSRPGIGADPAVSSSWPAAVRAVRAWLIPWSVLARCWRSWSPAPPPPQLHRLLDGVAAGRPLHLYLPP